MGDRLAAKSFRNHVKSKHNNSEPELDGIDFIMAILLALLIPIQPLSWSFYLFVGYLIETIGLYDFGIISAFTM